MKIIKEKSDFKKAKDVKNTEIFRLEGYPRLFMKIPIIKLSGTLGQVNSVDLETGELCLISADRDVIIFDNAELHLG